MGEYDSIALVLFTTGFQITVSQAVRVGLKIIP